MFTNDLDNFFVCDDLFVVVVLVDAVFSSGVLKHGHSKEAYQKLTAKQFNAHCFHIQMHFETHFLHCKQICLA